MRLHPFLLVLIGLFCGFTMHAQSPKQLIQWADENFADGDYYGAGLYYQQALEYDSTNIELLWKYAEALRLYNNYSLAEYYYQKIYKKERGKIYPESAFWLAVMQKNNGDYRKAQKTWKSFNRKYKRDKKSYYYLKSKQEMESCSWAREHLDDTTEVDLQNIDKPVNSYIAEFAAVEHDSILYFSTLRAKKYGDNREVHDAQYNINIYKSDRKNGQWDNPEAIDTTINSVLSHAANGTFSPDGKHFYFSRCPDLKRCDIWVSSFNNGSWSAPEMVKDLNKDGYTSTQPMLTTIGEKTYLFFASNRPNGEGKMDIWYAEMKAANNFTKPKNAGRTINTPDNEVTPFYHNDRLYFSSEWHVGFGGFDIHFTKGKPGAFGDALNMGQPFNTPANDFYFTIDAAGQRGYLSSNRLGSLYKKSPTCCNDIYTFEYPVDEDSIMYTSLDDLNKYLPVTLYFHNDEPDPRTTKNTTNRNYVDTWQEYTNRRNEYLTEYSKGLSGEQAEEARDDMNDFFDDRIEKGVKDLKVFAVLLLEELEKGQNIEITVQGFASPLAKTQYNKHLTGRRISSLENYLNAYEGGKFKPYINGTAANGGSLTFVRVPFGEYTADQMVSSNPNETEQSIFSIGAASERRIQIVSVKQANRDSAYAEMTFANEIHDFGNCFVGDKLSATFTFKNTGSAPLTIDSVAAACPCITVLPVTTTVAPGADAVINVQFVATDRLGLQAHTFTIFTNAVPEQKTLSITTEVFPKR